MTELVVVDKYNNCICIPVVLINYTLWRGFLKKGAASAYCF
jgi:hypothetical protein